MKRFTYLLSLTIAAFAVAAIGMVGCEGPAGPPGQNGTDGTDGTNGADMDATCKVCHNETSDLLAKQYQASKSGHMMNNNSERSSASCAACHTHEGFLDRMASGEMEASADIYDPTQPNCRTCHDIHEAYTEDDYAISYTDPVKLWINDVTVDYDNGNVCANCHQPRLIDPYPVAGGADVSITSSRWGPHHGPQAATVWGTSMYEIAGSESYPAAGSAKHADAGCVACHMVAIPEHGNLAGGHTLNMNFLYHGSVSDNVEGCVGCHGDIDDFDVNGGLTEMTALYDSLGAILVTKGWISETGSVKGSSSAPLVLAPDDAGALLNWRYMLEDKSMGIHNPKYMKAALKNSIAHLSK